jgi:hypothetical protein
MVLTEKLDQIIREENQKLRAECLKAGFQDVPCVFHDVNGRKGGIAINIQFAERQLEPRESELRHEAISRLQKRVGDLISARVV